MPLAWSIHTLTGGVAPKHRRLSPELPRVTSLIIEQYRTKRMCYPLGSKSFNPSGGGRPMKGGGVKWCSNFTGAAKGQLPLYTWRTIRLLRPTNKGHAAPAGHLPCCSRSCARRTIASLLPEDNPLAAPCGHSTFCTRRRMSLAHPKCRRGLKDVCLSTPRKWLPCCTKKTCLGECLAARKKRMK